MSREILLDSKRFQITGEIVRKNINPWTAKISSGSREYSDLSQASLREWHDLRGGLGLESELATETGRFYWSEGVDTSIERCLIPGPKVNTAATFGVAAVKIIDFAGDTYAIGTSVCKVWDPTGTPAWDVADAAALASPLDAIVVTDETSTYLVVSNATAARYTTDGSSWSALTGCKGYLAVFDNRLCGFYGHTLNYSPHGNIDGTWATFDVSAYLGTVNSLFEGKLLQSGDPVLYMATSEGLWAIDFFTQRIYKQEISFPPHDYAGYAGMYWNSYVWISTGAGIKKVTPSMATDVGVDQDDGLPSGYQGSVWDMEGLSDWMVFAVNGGTTDKSSIFKRHSTIGGNHQIYTTAAINNQIRCLHFSPSSMYANGRLWWGEGTAIKYCMLPDFVANPTAISDYEYVASSSKFILPIYRPLAVIDKVALLVRAITKNCDATTYITIYYKLDNGSWETALGTFTTSPQPTALLFAAGVGIEFRTITFGVEFTTASPYTTAPELESLMFGFLPSPEPIKGWQFNITATQDNAEKILSDLETIQDKNPLVPFYPTGNSSDTAYNVKLTTMPFRFHHEANRTEGQITVDVQQIFIG